MPDGELCPKCHTTLLDPFGDHLMCCRQNNFTTCHGALQDSLQLVLGMAKQPAEREQPLRQTNASRVLRQPLRPADILLRGWAGGRDVAVVLVADSATGRVGCGRRRPIHKAGGFAWHHHTVRDAPSGAVVGPGLDLVSISELVNGLALEWESWQG